MEIEKFVETNLVINHMDDNQLFDLLDQINDDNKTEPEKDIMQKFCKKCNTNDHIAEDLSQGIVVCIGCGSVVSDIYDSNPEWKQYPCDGGRETVARCSNATNFFLPQSSLGTTIACSNKSKIKMLNNWGAMPYKERSLHYVLVEIQDKCREAGILKCIEDDAKILYKNISESKYPTGQNKGKDVIIRGTNRKSLIAACIFYACKRGGKTRSPKEIARLFGLKYRDITKGCKTFIKLMKYRKLQYDVQISSAEHFITRYCRELHIGNDYIAQTLQIAKNINKLNIVSMHTPFSIAIGSIMLVIDINNIDISKKTIAKQFNISEVTVMKTFKQIEKYRNIIVNDHLTDKLTKLIDEENKKIVVPSKLQRMYDDIKEKEERKNLFVVKKMNEINDINEYLNQINNLIIEKIKSTEMEYKQLVSV